MIDDSYDWKDRVRRARGSLRRKLRRAKVDPGAQDAAFVEVEAFVFLTAYIIRKLVEARKLSDELEKATMSVTSYPANADYRLDFLNAHRIDRGYDFNVGSVKTIALGDLCNLIIHSFVFIPATNEEAVEWTGFFVNSDWTKSRELLFVEQEDFNLLVDEVIGDDIVTMHVNRIDNTVQKSRFPEGRSSGPVSLNARQAA